MAGRVSITDAMWKEVVQKLGKGAFTPLTKYSGSNTPVSLRHECGHVFEKTPHDWKRHPVCPKCNPPGRKAGQTWRSNYTKNEVQELLDRIHGVGVITIETEYTNISTPAQFRHTCGHVWSSRPGNLIKVRGATGCPACANTRRSLSHEDFIQRVAELPDAGEYHVVGRYIGAHKGIDIVHVSCGQIFRPSPVNFMAGTRCPVCNSTTNSSHVKKVIAGLDTILPYFGIEGCQREYAFPGGPRHPSGHRLCYDLWIPELELAIEVDGEFHDRPHATDPDPEATMARIRASDALRQTYADEIGIKLERIRWDCANLSNEAVRIVLDRALELEYVAFARFSSN
jgi:predicted Zn-ribbon and HTH transcriptional regulator